VVVLDTIVDGYSIDLIDDAFNANPASMAAGLEVLAAAHPRDEVGRVRGGRRVAILGDMLELGPTERALHAALADLPAMQAISIVHCVGPRMWELYKALPRSKRGHWVAEAKELTGRVASLVDAGDVVLVKGSKSSHVSLIVDAIRKLGHPLPEQEGSG
jgi:UDP-N-acetylmuramoyl-tripeptide--D-alanyl-D-alanine ligase